MSIEEKELRLEYFNSKPEETRLIDAIDYIITLENAVKMYKSEVDRLSKLERA